MLTKFPPEVLQMVAGQLPKADLKSLSLVSVYTRRAVIRSLWSSITIHSSDEAELHDITTEGFPDSRIPHASELRFAAPFPCVQDMRCPHFYSTRAERGKMFERLDQRAKSFLDKFEKDKLRSFNWDMGRCVPEAILGEEGLLARMHLSLESLRLVTDPTCYSVDQASRVTSHEKMDLSPFRNLRSICWKGPVDTDHQLIDTVIKNNADRLDHLELDLLYWWKENPHEETYNRSHESHDDNPGYFGNTLKLHEHTTQPIFQNLTSLVLAHAPLGPAMVDMINFEVLRSLTLRLCPNWTAFTQRIVKMGLPVKLRTLELYHDVHISVQTTQVEMDSFYDRPIGQFEVEEFIDVCGGLEELFLNLPKPFHAWSLWEHIARHEASLKRLTLHHRTRYHNRIHLYGQDVDLPNLGLTEHGDRLYHPPLQNPLRELKLECISLCCFPDLAELMLKTSSCLPWLKLIHIRQTGRERQVFGSMAIDRGSHLIDTYERNNQREHYFNDFDGSFARIIPKAKTPEPQIPFPTKLQDAFRSLAEWAFSPDGPPLLEAVAYGDFTHEGRVNTEKLILCPGPNGFRQTPKGGYEWMSIVEKFRNVLEACPTKPLLMWPSGWVYDVEDW